MAAAQYYLVTDPTDPRENESDEPNIAMSLFY